MSELSVRELPLFPLPDVVLFPEEVLPLHIFESRYRIMLRTVLETDSRFGVVRWDPGNKRIAEIGCCAEIINHKTSDDGRSNIIALGQQRFRILEVTRETPFKSAMISWIEDENVDQPERLNQLTSDVASALRDVVDLTGKLTGREVELPNDLPDLPRELSFWIGSHLGGPIAEEQQRLLEITNTEDRLKYEYEMLDHTRRQLAARTVIQDTFSNKDKTKD